MESSIFLVFGLGFFIFCVWLCMASNREDHNRRIMEAREFGYNGKYNEKLQSPKE